MLNLMTTLKHTNMLIMDEIHLDFEPSQNHIIERAMVELPTNIYNYHDLLLCGGQILTTILKKEKKGEITIDGQITISHEYNVVTLAYKHLQLFPSELYNYLSDLENELAGCGNGHIIKHPTNISEARQSPINYYNWIKAEYNGTDPYYGRVTVKASAMLIFLNCLCANDEPQISRMKFRPLFNRNNPNPIFKINKKQILNISELLGKEIGRAHV
jgi:hypothetical protein